MDYQNLHSLEELNQKIKEDDAALVYFSAPFCNVCKVLKPKISEMLSREYPKINLYYVDIEKSPVISGQFRIFSIPTLLLFFEGREFIRKSRNIGIDELEKEISRPYSMMFSD